MADIFEKIKTAVMEGQEEAISDLVQRAIESGDAPEKILSEGLVAGMDEVAILFRDGDMFVPEVIMAANAMQRGNDLLKPLLVDINIQKRGKIVLGTVEGDLHDIGKKIVAMMLEGAGFEVIDIGMDVSAEKFIGALKETQANLVGMSAMLTTTMPVMKSVMEAIRKEGLNVKGMIGGAPVNEMYAEEIGANYSYDAASAVDLAKELTN